MAHDDISECPSDISDYLNSKDHNKPHLGVLGTGNYGLALANKFKEAGLNFSIGSRSINEMSNLLILTYDAVIERSGILFLCVPPYAYGSIVPNFENLLRDKIVVDVSNVDSIGETCNALKLQEMLPNSHIMKALNTVSAYALQFNTYGVSRSTFVCGDDENKKKILMNILRDIGLNPTDSGSLQHAKELELLPHRFFPNWGTALSITLLVLIPVWFYQYLRFFWYKDQKDISNIGLYEANDIIAWVMFWVLALTYLPGVIAGFVQLARGTKYSRFPGWLDRWMKCRKQLGLISLFLCGIHGCMSCLLLGAGELNYMLTNINLTVPRDSPVILYQSLDWSKQVSLLFATLSLALMAVLGVTSLPSVNAIMSWKEWDFVQRGLGFLCLVFGFLHVMIYVYQLWDPDYKDVWKLWEKDRKGNMPPGTFIMPMLPLLVIALKLILMMPGISCYLNKIRRGKIGYKTFHA